MKSYAVCTEQHCACLNQQTASSYCFIIKYYFASDRIQSQQRGFQISLWKIKQWCIYCVNYNKIPHYTEFNLNLPVSSLIHINLYPDSYWYQLFDWFLYFSQTDEKSLFTGLNGWPRLMQGKIFKQKYVEIKMKEIKLFPEKRNPNYFTFCVSQFYKKLSERRNAVNETQLNIMFWWLIIVILIINIAESSH